VRSIRTLRLCVSAVSLALAAAAQTPTRLTLEEAEALAVKNHPAVSAALLTALAANQVTTEVHSAAYPTLAANLTAAGAMDGSRLAAGSLNNPIIYNRVSTGVTISQVLTDFGRTSHLTESARQHAQAQQEVAQATRAQVLIQVDRAYFAALRSQKVLEVARQTVAARGVVTDQVTALAESKLKSGLDLSFAKVNLTEAKLLLAGAENNQAAAFAELAAALGISQRQVYEVADVPPPPDLAAGLPELIAEALDKRPEVAALRSEQGAALSFARAEKALSLPTLSALAGVGVTPGHEETLRGRYGALGFNLNVPVFNGHLFSARRTEADFRAQAAGQRLRELQNTVARDVELAWLNANTAQQRLGLTAELLAQASLALELAQARYDLGLGSIVELSQAQLNRTSAEISSATARYDYALLRAVLRYQAGELQ
jgi:outer membrane protein